MSYVHKLLVLKWSELLKTYAALNEFMLATFTLSNLGMFGVDKFDAILPLSQGAIMAVGASKPTVVADADGYFSVKNKMLDVLEWRLARLRSQLQKGVLNATMNACSCLPYLETKKSMQA
ncbi:dihydrolipoyllysine-residue acetyltransferase component 4 of pyruvate dehydrogenase complex, chloroplastic-like isoform X2 [Silene latifolia]|uniref:dihydrolipoyllysine-residue acetyltransferase component 4 of pyruvate dehydrogenase complex, chloroplastic-like isoform X2 n=1 Tax=Silene latifolia TaxID=37657 RepID=UPI003D770F85